MHHLILATRNAHKTREFAQILGPGFSVSDLTACDQLPAVEESGQTFEENAVLKAVAASRQVSGLVVSDDSGLEVMALGGAPGVRSARYAGKNASDAENVAKVLAELHTIDPEEGPRAARFCCALALAEGGKVVRLFHGTAEGTIISPPRGEGGFGYDPIFVPVGYAETFSELGETVKNRISHRAMAIARLRDYFEKDLKVRKGPD